MVKDKVFYVLAWYLKIKMQWRSAGINCTFLLEGIYNPKLRRRLKICGSESTCLQISKEERQASAEPLDSYVVVEKEDVLDAIGTFVAAYLAELPEAQNLKPAELQRAIQNAFKVNLDSGWDTPCVV